MSCAASCLASGEELPGAIKMEGFNRQRVDHLPFLWGDVTDDFLGADQKIANLLVKTAFLDLLGGPVVLRLCLPMQGTWV